jgi:hypothetical protein
MPVNRYEVHSRRHQGFERDALDMGFNQSEKYIADALDPIVKFRNFSVFGHVVI